MTVEEFPDVGDECLLLLAHAIYELFKLSARHQVGLPAKFGLRGWPRSRR
jgi:hypothetical protein